MKKRPVIRLFSLLCFSLSLSAQGEERQYIGDPSLRQGMVLLAPEPINGVGMPIDTLRLTDSPEPPVWRLCSWTFPTEFTGRQPSKTQYGNGFSDSSFHIFRSRRGTITMAVEASEV